MFLKLKRMILYKKIWLQNIETIINLLIYYQTRVSPDPVADMSAKNLVFLKASLIEDLLQRCYAEGGGEQVVGPQRSPAQH